MPLTSSTPNPVTSIPAQFEDRYENALVDLLKKKEAGEKIEPAKAGPAPRVVNLMEALRASIDADEKEGTGTQCSGSATC